MPLILYACLNAECWTMYFKTESGRCPSCSSVGTAVRWGLKQPRPPDDPRES